MVAIGETNLNSASVQMDQARKEVKRSESEVKLYSDRVSEYERKLSKARSDIKVADRKICDIVVKLKSMSAKREAVADFQGDLREAVDQLTKVCGVGSVAELQSRHLIVVDTMMTVMDEMMAALKETAGNELLYREGLKDIMSDMQCVKLQIHSKIEEEKLEGKQVEHTNMSE